MLQRLIVLAIVATGVFALLELATGDAVDAYLATTGGGDGGFAAALRDEFGLGGTLLSRYAHYLGRIAMLDLGTSIAFGRPVVAVLLERLPVTLALMGTALVLTSVLGTVLGVVAARRPGGILDAAVTAVALAANATPGFVVGLVLLLVFAVQLGWFPIGGIRSFRAPEGIGGVLDMLRHMVLPVATLTLTYAALYVRVARAEIVAVDRQEHVRAARAKGVGGLRLLWRHRLRPGLTPLVTLLGVQAGAMLGGSVVVETVFAVPGFGSLAAMAVSQRDVVLLAGTLLAGAALVMASNALVDTVCRLIDPRVGVDRAATPKGAR